MKTPVSRTAPRAAAHEQPQLELPSTVNAELVDGLALDRLLTHLYESYDPELFSDLCGLLVQAVLRDRILLVPSSTPVFANTAFIEPWLKDGVAIPLRMRRTPNGEFSQLRKAARRPPYAEAAHLIVAAAERQLPAFTTWRERKAFEAFAHRRYEHALCDLLAQYRRLEDRMVRNLIRYGLLRPNYAKFMIPPIPLQIFKRCATVHDIATATLEVRWELQSIRRRFGDLNAMLADNQVDFGRKLRELRKAEAQWAAVEKAVDGYALISFSNSAGYMLNGASGTAQAAFGYMSGSPTHMATGGATILGNAAATFMSAVGDRARAWRLEPIYQAFHQCLNVSGDEMVRNLQRLFGPPRQG